MKKYLWVLHVSLGSTGLFSSILQGDALSKFSYLSITLSSVALLCLTVIHVVEINRKK